MSRWDYDTVFYRVFCITLLAVAFTFTVILTNVFVDIDGLLSTKDKVKTSTSTEGVRNDLNDILTDNINVNIAPEDESEDIYDDKDYPDSSDLYRSKRSLDTPDSLFHIKDPKVKKLLTNHLAELLDELDERESDTSDQVPAVDNKTTNKPKPINENDKMDKTKKRKKSKVTEDENSKKNDDQTVIENLKNNKESERDKGETKIMPNDNNDELHLAMHNVILQGIMGNMDFDDVYKQVADLVKKFENNHSKMNKDEFKKLFKETNIEKPKQITSGITLLDNLLRYKNTEKQTDSINSKRNMIQESDSIQRTKNVKPKDQNIIIKTIINITAMSNDKTNKENDANPRDKLNGIIKVMYNGKSIKFKSMDDHNYTNSQSMSNSLNANNTGSDHNTIEDIGKNNFETEINKPNQRYFKKVMQDYLRRFQELSDSSEKRFSTKRLKRHIKIRYDHDTKDKTLTEKDKTTTEKPKPKKDDDELFVEIETHFDSKGAKGEKKKKMIRDLIEKIQKAIHSNKKDKKKKPKHWHVKKRIQNPLVSKSAAAFLNKLMLPLETLAQRHLDPISKVVPVQEEVPFMPDNFGHDYWLQKYQGPRFFSKGINSAEMSKVETDYSKVMSHNGIPQRLQKPLNTDISDEVLQDSNIIDLGNIKFLMKDIDGTGFSIGFNQYTDEAPDTETMKLFSGLENIIQTYHQKYDQELLSDIQHQNIYDNTANPDSNVEDFNENQEQMDKSNQHLIQRRSIKGPNEPEHHKNKYKIIYSHNFWPYDSYQEIYEDKEHMTRVKSMQLHKTKQENKSALFIDENVFEKDLKPAEILSIADLFERRKRSLNVKKISNFRIKKKANRKYLNTKSMASKKVFMNNKRNKRQIDKIRIIARDVSQAQAKSEEDFFIVSDEKLFADRALVKEINLPEPTHIEKIPSVENYEIPPQKEEDPYDIMNQHHQENEDNYDIINPYVYEVSPFEIQNEFTRRARHNPLMSKYPHIILDETHRSLDPTEHIFPENYYIEASTAAATPIFDISSLNEKEIVELVTPPKDNTNYRVSVKIRPKNSTGMSGFKEVHTSINKKYNKNGLMYTSLVNVSQVSKVENMNKTVSRRQNLDLSPSAINLKQQQELIKSLIRQHRHRLDHQLKQLQIEKEKLDTMNVETQDALLDKKTEMDNSANKMQLAQEEARETFNLNTPPTTVATSKLTEITTTAPATTTTAYVQPIADDIIKIKMINSIERNENITNELLKKIDHNTGILKTFLGKLIANLDISNKKTNAEDDKHEETDIKNDKKPEKDEELKSNAQVKQPDIINNHIPYNFEDYHRQIPHLFFRNVQRQSNNSVGIPFVYAYQQPYGMVPSKETSMASIVYHGHIHTNTMTDNVRTDKTSDNKVVKANEHTNDKKEMDRDFWKPKPGEKVLNDFVMKNKTKFFLDDSNFKVISVNATKL